MHVILSTRWGLGIRKSWVQVMVPLLLVALRWPLNVDNLFPMGGINWDGKIQQIIDLKNTK